MRWRGAVQFCSSAVRQDIVAIAHDDTARELAFSLPTQLFAERRASPN
jgi:hypothetical protein